MLVSNKLKFNSLLQYNSKLSKLSMVLQRPNTLMNGFYSFKASANALNNTQHCWAQQCCLLLRDVSRYVQTLATSHNMLGL